MLEVVQALADLSSLLYSFFHFVHSFSLSERQIVLQNGQKGEGGEEFKPFKLNLFLPSHLCTQYSSDLSLIADLKEIFVCVCVTAEVTIIELFIVLFWLFHLGKGKHLNSLAISAVSLSMQPSNCHLPPSLKLARLNLRSRFSQPCLAQFWKWKTIAFVHTAVPVTCLQPRH